MNDKMTMKEIRNSNIELLRIFAMLGILGCHLVGHGIRHCIAADADVIYYNGSLINRFFANFFEIGGVGNAIFFMISGFFLINKKDDTIKLAKIILESLFYAWASIIIFLVMYLFGIEIPDLLMKDAINAIIKGLFIPASGGIWWFVTTYIFLNLLTPVINRFINSLNKRSMSIFLVFFWGVWYTVASMDADYAKLQSAIFFYLVGGYIKMYHQGASRKKCIISLIISFISIACYGCFSFVASNSLNGMNDGIVKLAMDKAVGLIDTALFVPIVSVSLFVAFKNMNIKANKKINCLGASTFGVYLLSDSPITRSLFWNKLFRIDSIYLSAKWYWFVIYSIFAIIVLFLFCSFVDQIRLRFIEPCMMEKYQNLKRKLIHG
jgi:hypothetical protein